ncbi:MAG: DNA-binding protein [Lachnospiraceae bacterium]|nr:DNA-binding protein [Lachnospiraceae bacterium]MBR0149347.1 DNA-binding protein [Lachnospiraceae bacterium]MBR4174960.1 DNA-binding protein [Lachnospiraceae bacterium]
MTELDEIEYNALLFDFYGSMLTSSQADVFRDHVLDDLTVSEIAQNRGVTRQAASDIIKRTKKILSGYEDKLHLVDRFLKIKEQVEKIDDVARNMGIDEITALTDEILEEL